MKTLANVGPADLSTVFDVGHLDRQTMGDPTLRVEILALFLAQLRRKADELDAGTAADRAAVAHALYGAARGVGAVAVAAASRRLEFDPGDREARTALLDAIGQALTVLDSLESMGQRS